MLFILWRHKLQTNFSGLVLDWPKETYRSFLMLDISRLFCDKIEDYLLFSKKFKAKVEIAEFFTPRVYHCLLYTSDAAAYRRSGATNYEQIFQVWCLINQRKRIVFKFCRCWTISSIFSKKFEAKAPIVEFREYTIKEMYIQ